MVKAGRFGEYVTDGEFNATLRKDDSVEAVTLERAAELLAERRAKGPAKKTAKRGAKKAPAKKTATAKKTAKKSTAKKSTKKARPRTGSLFKDMSLETINLEQAVRLLSLPRVVGVDGEGVEITAQNGRYGPYLKKGTDSRSIDSEDKLLSITLEEALKIYAQPKQRGRAAAAPPLKELGNDPVSGQPIVVKAGRFGEYVTDGEFNATLRKDDSVEAVTLERAAELLAERRAKGPATKKTAKRGAKKTTAKKTATAKTTAKKSTAKKTTKKATAKKS